MAGYEIWALCAVAVVFLAGGVVKGGIGLGLPTVSIGLMAIWMPVSEAAGILILPVILTNIWQSFFGTALKLVLTRLWTMLIALVIGSAAAAILIASANQALADGLLGTMLILYARTEPGYRAGDRIDLGGDGDIRDSGCPVSPVAEIREWPAGEGRRSHRPDTCEQ